ncbi:Succinate-semialdehyde dehydrogenase, mitochondrial [Geodia barretti]|nr:Succinate-semialdehyde dehydrogenase, mitochondrial [Geodia barretti]
MANKEELAKLITVEAGKVLRESRGEVDYGASFISWNAEEAKRIEGEVLSSLVPGRRTLLVSQPVGVAALVTPWNFPVAMITRKAGPALAAGCAVVVKPSEETPFSALAIAELAHEAGIPPGVFNVVTSSRDSTPSVGTTLASSDLVRKLSFTGSTTVGKLLMAQCASTVKKVSLELGGNAPLLIFNSADIDQAVAGAMASKFRNTGQTCICTNRILVQRGVHDEFVEKLVSAVSKLVQGNPFDESSQQGPLINEAAAQKVENHVNDAVEKGAELLVGGARAEELGSLFFRPSVAVGVSGEMRVTCEETFGPLAAVMTFDDEEEGITMANATPFGLAGYFYSGDPGQIWRVSEALETGMVGVNETMITSENTIFGGMKQSGLGKEGGRYGLREYLETKFVCMGGIAERPVD